MNAKRMILGLAALMICGLVVMLSHRSPSHIVSTTPQREVAPAPRVEAPPVSVEPALPPELIKGPQLQPAPKAKAKPAVQAQNTPSNNTPKEALHDPEARDALALVGVDPDAEQYWLQAIFDTSLPDHEREDLMEDLNETGFADPGNLTADDLPLIMNRLQIIAAVLPNADDFMTEHLLEAQKDLMNMAGRVAQ